MQACSIHTTWRFSVVLALFIAATAVAEESSRDVENRLARFTQFLSSDELGGRGIGTPGIETAAEAIAEQFELAGLDIGAVDGTPFQTFSVVTASELGEENRVVFVSPDREETQLELSKQYTPLAIGGSAEFDLPLVFVGYGITAKELKYDDYANIDVEGKAVIVLRHEPQQDNPHSGFDGTDHSRHATFREKASNAYQHGAAAVLFVTGKFEVARRQQDAQRRWQMGVRRLAELAQRYQTPPPLSSDQMDAYRRQAERLSSQIERTIERERNEPSAILGFQGAGPGDQPRDFAILHLQRDAIDRILQSAGKRNLATLEDAIDDGPQPHSFALDGWRIRGQTEINRKRVDVKNVIGVLEGEGPHADETIVIGAHYDHLGRGGPGSAAPGSKEIHNGADDNASGTAALTEIARQLVSRDQPLPRRVVFIAFTGEERGLLGSAHYVEHPIYPLDKTVAMLNLDMVGRLRDDKLIVNGTGTSPQFEKWVDESGADLGFAISKIADGFGPSDHSSFYGKNIPVLHFFTDLHSDYHKPSDDFEQVNISGIRRVAELVADLAVRIAELPQPPEYVAVARQQPAGTPSGTRPYLGSIPDFSQSGSNGYKISGVAPDGPAARAGLKGGDAIVKFGEFKIANLQDITTALHNHEAGDKVPVEVMRDGQRLSFEVVLEPPK